VWHRLGRDDFARTSEMRLERRRGSNPQGWKVCREGYDYQNPPVDAHYEDYSLVPKHSVSREEEWRTYYPLEDTPNLFLDFTRLYRDSEKDSSVNLFEDDPDFLHMFARLYREKDKDSPTDAVLNWVRRYGLLGYGGGAYGGGPEDTVENYLGSSYWAAGILAMYEAALNGDQEAAKAAVLEEFLPVDPVGYSLNRLGKQEFSARKAKTIEERYSGSYLEYALDTALYLVTSNVREECLPTLFLPEGVEDPSKISASLSFKSLYGAMYLQIYWLMAAGGNVTRCRWCGQIISLISPVPGARKTRQDKTFCGNACRQRHHYHTKTKPRRQSER
jgi:hypothetical protein